MMQATRLQPKLCIGRPRKQVVVRAGGNGASPVCELKEGGRVKVKEAVTVWHVGKFKEGLQLQGREGVVQKNEAQYNWKGQDMALSANLPWKVQFSVDGPEGKPVKVIAHLSEDELEALD